MEIEMLMHHIVKIHNYESYRMLYYRDDSGHWFFL